MEQREEIKIVKCPKCGFDLDDSVKNFFYCKECVRHFKRTKLRKVNSMKYCLHCREIVEINMIGLDGFCPNCPEKVFTLR